MPSVTLKWDSKGLDVWRDQRVAKALAKALKKAGNTSIKALRAEAKRQVRAKSSIRAGYLADKALPLDYPQGSEIRDLIWTMHVSGKAVPLGEFPRRQVKAGVSIQVYKSSGRQVITHAFLALSKSGRLGVFLRPTTARYPMGHKLGPNVADTLGNPDLIDAVIRRTQEVFGRDFARLLPLEVAKVKP